MKNKQGKENGQTYITFALFMAQEDMLEHFSRVNNKKTSDKF